MFRTIVSRFAVAGLLGFFAPSAFAQEVSFAWTPSADTPQIVQAIDKSLWKESGLAVKMVSFATGREALEALIGGQVDFASMAELPAVTGAMRQQKFAVISILSKYRGNRIIAKDIEIKSVRDLAGKKVATTLGTNSHFALDFEVQRAGITVEVVNASPPDIVPALVRGDVDAAVMFPAFFPQAKRTLGAQYRELITPDYVTHMVLVGTADVLEKRPEDVKKLLAGLLKADGLVAANAAETQEAIVRVVGRAANLDAIRENWPSYSYKMTLDNELLTLMTREGEWIAKRGLVKNVEATDKLFRSFISDKPMGSLDPGRVQVR